MKKYDLAVLGGGVGGYPAAIKAAQHGRSVALIEANTMGGTCLNRGCIPTKTLIAQAEEWQRIGHAKEFGIEIKGASFDFAAMTQRKDRIVEDIRKSLTGLIQSNKIDIIRGYGKFTSPSEIKVMGEDNCIIQASKCIIATGSEPRNMPLFPFDNKRIHSSTSIMELTKLPASLAIIGGGVIGCEFASLYHSLGVKITILELMPTILPTESPAISSVLAASFQKRGINIRTQVNVQGIDTTKNGVSIRIGAGETVDADMVLVAVGRSLNTSQIGLEKAGVLPNDNGIIPVNERMETSVPGIYAIGDIASKWWLAHVATHQGIVAANNACDIESTMHYNAIPVVIFTDPEIASVGMSVEQAFEKGYNAVAGAFPFQALGKSQATAHTEGFAQVVQDKKTGQILGAQVIGYEAATLIAEMAVAITNELTVECITETIHAHPTISEAWMEAVFMAQGSPLHLPPRKRKING